MTDLQTDEVVHGAESSSGGATIRRLIHHAAHYLPAQGPIEVFVHHNTLHAFESESFHDAIRSGQRRYGAEGYLSEREYRQLYDSGRIVDRHLRAALAADLGEQDLERIDGLGTRGQIRLAMLQQPLLAGPDAELRWIVAETDALDRFRPGTSPTNRARMIDQTRAWLNHLNLRDASSLDNAVGELREPLQELWTKLGRDASKWSDAQWESFSLNILWRVVSQGVKVYPPKPAARNYVRPRDVLLHAVGEDIDRNVHNLLIRFCAAYVDQGYSDWALPNRERGFFESFVELYAGKSRGLDRWLRKLPDELEAIRSSGASAAQSIELSLAELRIAEEDWEEFIVQSLLALGGWAGMIWQLESGVDWVVHAIPAGSLEGMLAIQLLLEKHAIRHVGESVFGGHPGVQETLRQSRERLAEPKPLNLERRAFLLFQVAQMLGWTPPQLLSLGDDDWRAVSEEVESFSSIERRRVFHEAYERQFRHAALDAFSHHAERRRQLPKRGSKRPAFQMMTCIDDREESFRRHLEEVEPRCETFGAAGFFAVAIYYRGAADGFYKPLCPGVITPDHYVQEDVGYTFEGVHRGRANLRRRLGLASHAFHTRSRTFIGGIVTGIVGSLATAPLVARVLFPRLTARIRRRFGSLLQPPPVTKLQLERFAPDPGPDNGHIGYTTDEMAGVVTRLLQDIGLTKSEDFSRLFIACGHGSSSLNNPHESAYCCGACAGKRGGPNARAFAEMANDWRVRAKVSALGIDIPDDTVFVGAYHNTCDDSVVFYDLDRMPASHREDFESAREAIEEARRRNAHERCRRFVSAPLNVSARDALRHVEARAQDISQARPEYNHATNALCLVGRRAWSRGLFLDRRSFLTSYDPTQDDAEHSILLRILSAAIPVCAGISLEYYFSTVDYSHYGSGSKLPHNIVSLLGVMEGTSSDLRTGLYQQMVEIHEPLRLLFVIETTPEAMLSIMQRNAAIARLCQGGWVHLAVLDAETSEIQVFCKDHFEPYQVEDDKIALMDSSLACYQGSRKHLPFSSIRETEIG
ncbi:MAG: DUF2309 domain-containing protein [Planctomycetales bacterium]|nr:DUF2309 domain-containing protein [Planctomycetales bacterium]